MRSSDERIASLHERAGEMRKTARARKVRIMQITSSVACVAFVIALAAFMPGIETKPMDTAPGGLHGSIFTETSSLGYIVVGIVAFLLGTALTMFLFRLREWREDRDREDEAL